MERLMHIGPGVCTALEFRLVVDAVLNEGAIQEAHEATDTTHGPGEDATDTAGSAYNLEDEIEFQPNTAACDLCGGEACLRLDGSVTADSCSVSGSCELAWARMHGDQYLDEDGELQADLLPCGGFECKAVINLSLDGEGVAADLAKGLCAVDIKGEHWRRTGRAVLDNMKPAYDNRLKLEPFDGERL